MLKLIDAAKAMIDAHALIIEEMLDQLEKLGGGAAVTSVKPQKIQILETLGLAEEAFTKLLEPEAVMECKLYAELKLSEMRERALKEFPKIGVNVFCKKGLQSLRAHLAGAPMNFNPDPRLSYAAGFLICHRKCCANGAGNGVAAGIGCWDCNDNVYSEGCPPV